MVVPAFQWLTVLLQLLLAMEALQQEYLKRRKLNTFQVHSWDPLGFTVVFVCVQELLRCWQERRKEGRTAYTKASRTAIIVGSLGLSGAQWCCFFVGRSFRCESRIFNIMAIVLPNWRSSWVRG